MASDSGTPRQTGGKHATSHRPQAGHTGFRFSRSAHPVQRKPAFAVLQKAVSSLCEAAIENVLTAATDAQWQTLVDCHETIYQSLLNRDAQAGMAAIDQHYTQPFSDSLNTPLG